MRVFPGLGTWISHNNNQNAESKRSSKSVSEMDANNVKIYYDKNEEKKQLNLWRDAEKKHPWYDAPPKVKVKTMKGICHMNIELTVGLPPDGVYDMFTNPNDIPFFTMDNKAGRELLENKSRKILKEDGPRQIAKMEKALAWDFFWWSGSIPIDLIVHENKQDLTAKYKKEKMMFMRLFEGNYKVEPLFVDSQRLCNNMIPKTREEYMKCSGGQGKIASKVTMDQYFQPYPPFNLPPFSWYISETTIKTTKTLLKILQFKSAVFREVSSSSR